MIWRESADFIIPVPIHKTFNNYLLLGMVVHVSNPRALGG